MPNTTNKLTWCKARLGNDHNWWVDEISDPVHWDIDGLGIIDPRQFQHILDLVEPLADYGLQTGMIEDAFFAFAIDEMDKQNRVVLRRVEESLLDSGEQLFALPDILDEERGPYADLIDHLTKLRVKMLNDLIDFAQNLTVEELEEEIRETQNLDFMEGRGTHFFPEITSILEYVPEGFELEDETGSAASKSEDSELQEDVAEVDENTEETLEADDTMKWDEDEDDEESEAFENEQAPAEDEPGGGEGGEATR